MATYYLKDDLDKAFAGFNAALAALPTYHFDAPMKPPSEALSEPAMTAEQALKNARAGYLMDGVTRSTDSQSTLDKRAANWQAWKTSPAMNGVPSDSGEYGVLIGRIHDVSPFGVPTGSPRPTEIDFVALQDQVDAALNAGPGGPSGG